MSATAETNSTHISRWGKHDHTGKFTQNLTYKIGLAPEAERLLEHCKTKIKKPTLYETLPCHSLSAQYQMHLR